MLHSFMAALFKSLLINNKHLLISFFGFNVAAKSFTLHYSFYSINMKHYDIVIIGTGQAGVPLAKKLGKRGLKTAIIERKFVGGTCMNAGCTPTKAMVASARVMHLANTANEVGVNVSGVSVNLQAVIERKNKIVTQFRTGAENGLLKTENVDLILGHASFVSNKEIKILLNNNEEENITTDKVFINTGARPAIPEIEGLKDIHYLTSTTIMNIDELPEHLLVIGASYIALEFGQMFKRFGSKVTILEHTEKFLSREDDDVANEIKIFLEEEQLEIFTNASVQRFSSNNKQIKATVKINDAIKEIMCSHVLVAVGRTPNTDDLKLENTKVETDKGYIVVTNKLETNEPDIYALGDVKGGPAFTHISYNDYLIVYNNLYEGANESIKNRMVPYTMFTDPQFGKVGINEKEAKQQQLNFKVAILPMSHVARGIETNETTGFIKAIVDADTKQILGGAAIGEQGGEIMSMLQLSMMGKIPYDVLRSAVFAHPLYAEALNILFMKLDSNK
jgi:pyruvate/2-oxoglutarate dehydrogenase complex dihydrolipoamide dehydrogenase (E3) component